MSENQQESIQKKLQLFFRSCVIRFVSVSVELKCSYDWHKIKYWSTVVSVDDTSGLTCLFSDLEVANILVWVSLIFYLFCLNKQKHFF